MGGGGEPVGDFYDLVAEISAAASGGSLALLLTYARGRFAGERRAYLERLVANRETALRAGRYRTPGPVATGRLGAWGAAHEPGGT